MIWDFFHNLQDNRSEKKKVQLLGKSKDRRKPIWKDSLGLGMIGLLEPGFNFY